MDHRTDLPIERLGLVGFTLLTLSPAVFQGLWVPLTRAAQVELTGSTAACAAAVLVSAVELLTFALLHHRAPRPWLPAAVGSLVALGAGLTLGGGAGSTATLTLALLGVAALHGLCLPRLFGLLPTDLDGLVARHRVLAAFVLLVGLVGVHTTASLSVYMGDLERADLSLAPDEPFITRHSCLTAYVQGASFAAQRVDNLYDAALWPALGAHDDAASHGAYYAPFPVDSYVYPPPFLLLPRLLLTPLHDFASQRAVWYAFNAVMLAAGLWTVATWLGGRHGTLALLLVPFIWTSAPTLGTLQIGNAHALVTVAAMLAFVAIETRRPALGGALLAFAVVSKLSPGLLVLVLVLRGQHREVGWTTLWCLLYALTALAAFGPAPYEAFLTYELPRLASGEALSFLAGAETVPINFSPFGVPFKLLALGVPLDDPWGLARLLNQVFTALLLLATVLAALRQGDERSRAVTWAALLTLAALRSPLAPGYVGLSLLWMFSMQASQVRSLAGGVFGAALWFGLSNNLPGTGATTMIVNLAQQAVLYCLLFYVLVRGAATAQVAPNLAQPVRATPAA